MEKVNGSSLIEAKTMALPDDDDVAVDDDEEKNIYSPEVNWRAPCHFNKIYSLLYTSYCFFLFFCLDQLMMIRFL